MNRDALLLAAFGLACLGAPLIAQAPSLTLTGVDYTNAWSLGRSASGVGDVDADGFGDIALGANAGGYGGPLRVYSGGTGALLTSWTALDHWVATGMSIQRLGDLDGDGVAEVVYGSPDDHPDGAWFDAVTVRSGADGTLLWQILPTCAAMQAPRVSGAGDVDGDGVEDVVLGDLTGWGEVKVFSGVDGSELLQFDGLVGASVSELGDLNGDGTADLLIAGRLSGTDQSGVVRVHSGVDGSTLLVIGPRPAADWFGHALELVGDMDGDRLPDAAVGAPQPGLVDDGGYVQFVSTSTGAVLGTLRGAPGDALGWSLIDAGDVNGDSVADLLVGAPQPGNAGPGKVLVVSGLDGSLVRCWAGEGLGDRFGAAVGAAGDVNGDGFDDVVVGAPDGGPPIEFGYAAGYAQVLTGCPGVMAPYGEPCSGSGGFAPMLTMGGCPVPGGAVELQVSRALGHTLAYVLAGFPAGTPAPMASGCSFQLAPPFLVVTPLPIFGAGPGQGVASLAGTLPAIEGTLALQVFIADPAVTGGYVATNGLLLTIEN
ncbi:MAG TPA: integrin alpha [Planctomycetota bacterium]|nr:integrin alpha [Planctomycetota bacterium]